MNQGNPSWQQLGQLLVQRRTALDPRWSNRQDFAEAHGLNYRLVYDIEEAKRTNFSAPTLAGLEAAYQLRSGAIAGYIADGTPFDGEKPRTAFPPILQADEEAIAPYELQVVNEIRAAEHRYDTKHVTGEQAFPGSRTEARAWDDPRMGDEANRIRFIAKLRMVLERSGEARQAGLASG